ncbi:MAG: hypothetical protein ACI8T1_002521 [Verrucomicrobiales bacterium]|jgi:hypothetical protein
MIDWRKVVASEKKPRRVLRHLMEGVKDDPYLHWDVLERLTPPGRLTHDQWWAALKLSRRGRRQPLDLPSSAVPWSYTPIPSIHRLVDHLTGSNGAENDRWVRSAQSREAIYSCRLDGLPLVDDEITRQAVRALTPPVDEGMRAAWNVFRVISERQIRSLDETSAHLTAGTADEGTWPGLPKNFVKQVSLFIEGQVEGYVPPLVRATAIYAYVREALDGWPAGGRMARAIFVRSAVDLGISVISTLAWSKVLERAPKKLKRTLKQTLSDDHDLTYFLLHHLETLELALQERDLRSHRKRLAESELSPSAPTESLNERQRVILHRARHQPDTIFTIGVHQEAHGIVYETARKDFLELVRLGLFHQEKRQRKFVYRVAARADP